MKDENEVTRLRELLREQTEQTYQARRELEAEHRRRCDLERRFDTRLHDVDAVALAIHAAHSHEVPEWLKQRINRLVLYTQAVVGELRGGPRPEVQDHG